MTGFLFDGLWLVRHYVSSNFLCSWPVGRGRFCFLFSFWVSFPSRFASCCCSLSSASCLPLWAFLCCFCFCYMKCWWVVGLYPTWFVRISWLGLYPRIEIGFSSLLMLENLGAERLCVDGSFRLSYLKTLSVAIVLRAVGGLCWIFVVCSFLDMDYGWSLKTDAVPCFSSYLVGLAWKGVLLASFRREFGTWIVYMLTDDSYAYSILWMFTLRFFAIRFRAHAWVRWIFSNNKQLWYIRSL